MTNAHKDDRIEPKAPDFLTNLKPVMTLRDYFAGQALAGSAMTDSDSKFIAKRAYEYADAMLAAREVTQPDPVRDELVAAAREIVDEAVPHPHRINQALVRKSSLGELDAVLSRAKEAVK